MGFKILLFSFAVLVAATVASCEKKVICYYGTWAVDRPGLGSFSVDDVDADLCTHVMYAFAIITDNGTVTPFNTTLDIDMGNYYKFTALKQKNANLKTIISVGGWNEGSAKYSTMAASETLRANFINSARNLMVQYGFDGLDLDWEYPNRRDTTNGEADIDNYSTLLKELREAFDEHNFTVSAAVSPFQVAGNISYDVPTICKYLDWVGVMTYDMYGTWDSTTGHNSPLHAGEGDENANATSLSTVENSMTYWLNKGCPSEKLVVGMPLYGHSFRLTDASQHTVRSPSSGTGILGPYTNEAGTIGYNEVCELLKDDDSWTVVYDDLAEVPYTYKDTNWISYDNAQSLTAKVNYGLEKDVAGFLIWSIETDDFHGTCGEQNILLKTVNRALGKIAEAK